MATIYQVNVRKYKEKNMLNIDKIKEITAHRTSSFIEHFKNLRDKAHVDSYIVDLKNKTRTYHGSDKNFVENITIPSYTFSNLFNELAIKKALSGHQKNQTTYFEFLEEIAQAGVTHYRVDMIKNNVTYSNDSQAYVENIPVQ